MLLPNNIHPENTVYYNSSFLIEAISQVGTPDLIDLYQKVQESQSMSFPLFILCIDWLYLTDIAKLTKDGRIKLCS